MREDVVSIHWVTLLEVDPNNVMTRCESQVRVVEPLASFDVDVLQGLVPGL